MTYEQLRAIIIRHMQVFSGVEQSRIDYQNPLVRFMPPDSGLWCRLAIETARPVTQGLCTPQARIPGHIIVQCFEKSFSQAPTIELVRLADALVGHFQYRSLSGLLCREAQLVQAGTGASVGNPSGTGYVQTNVQIYFVTM